MGIGWIRRGTWRWTKRVVLGLVAVIILAIAITIGTLHTEWGRNRVRMIAQDQLQAAFPGSTIRKIDGSVFGNLIARDVTIMGRDKRPFITIKTVTLQTSLGPLLGKTARIDSLIAEDVVVYVHDQGPAPDAKPSTASAPSAWSVELPQIKLERARIEIERPTGTEIITDVDARVTASMRSGEPLRAAVNAHAIYRGEPIHITALASQDKELSVPLATVSLGGARLVAIDAHVDGMQIGGNVVGFVPASLVNKLAAVKLPADAFVLAHMTKTGQLELSADLGTSQLRVLARADLQTLTTHAIVTADVPEIADYWPAPAAGDPIRGRGTLVATVIASPERVDGMIAFAGEARGYAGTMMIGTAATLDRASIIAAGSGVGWRFGMSADLTANARAWTLARSQLVARAYDLERFRGELTADVSATGSLSPVLALSVTGTADGRNIRYDTDERAIRYDELAIARLHTRFSATAIPARPTGTAEIEVSGVQRGTVHIPSAMVAAHGLMHEDGTIDIDLDRHRMRTADGQAWGGSGGHVRVTKQSVAVTQIATTNGPSRITAQAQIGLTSDDLIAKLTARQISAATIDPTVTGTLAADVDVERRGGMWKGSVNVDAMQILIPKRPVLDGKLTIKLDKRRVTATATASNPAIGSATVDLDVIGPRDITDPIAWQTLERSAIQRIRIALSKIDASQLGASGSLDGELAIGALDAGGLVDVKGVVTDVGTLDSQLALSPGPKGEIAAHGTLHLFGVDPVDVDAIIALPVHPFDPARWQQMGRGALREATIEAKRIAFDPDLMKRFGVISPWRGWAAVKLKVGPGARSSDFVVDVHELRDGPLKKPVEVHIAGGSDAAGPHFDATIKSDKVVVIASARSPLSIEAMIAGNARTAPIEATVVVPQVAARDVALIIGRDDVLAGTLAGNISIAGTVSEPTARAVLAVDHLAVAAGIASKPPTLDKLEVDARWYGVKQGFELELTGHEPEGRLLKISARGKPEQPETIVATIEAANFDIRPFLAFAPPGSIAVGSRGLVSGVLKLKGLDPYNGAVKGRLVITNARFPLAAELGTFRNGTFEIDVVKNEIVTRIDGKIGRGTVKGKAILRLTGSMPTAAEVTLALRKVSPIGEIQPVINADVSGWFARTKTKWTGNIKVANADVYVPPETGNELLITGSPADIVFIDAQPVLVKPKRRPPTAPWLIATVDIGRTKILVDDDNFKFEGAASGQLQLKLGDGIGLDGAISTERGIVDVLGRRYRLDHGIIDFDGSLDPRLDIQMMHDFRSLTLTVNIRGRSSTPDLRLASDTGSYSQGQLLSFLAGATPSDDPSQQQSGDAVASGSLTLLSSRLGKRINKRLPLIKFDTINYEAKTASTSRAIRVGKRIGDHTYLNFRNRFEVRPDENAHEAVLEYEVRKDVIFEAAGGERGGGGDLLWRKRW
jgi:hypothetical protein